MAAVAFPTLLVIEDRVDAGDLYTPPSR